MTRHTSPDYPIIAGGSEQGCFTVLFVIFFGIVFGYMAYRGVDIVTKDYGELKTRVKQLENK